MAAAEQIAREHGFTQSTVISGVCVRDYCRHLGYRSKDTYVTKKI